MADMDISDYQREARRTAGPGRPQREALTLGGLGIAGEAGEVADHIKKIVYHDHPLDTAKLAEELGEVMEANIAKLRARYPDGWSAERSQNRPEYQQAAPEDVE
jgi:NTP pyrophosphatase (non-canonical NTP hydrolase)